MKKKYFKQILLVGAVGFLLYPGLNTYMNIGGTYIEQMFLISVFIGAFFFSIGIINNWYMSLSKAEPVKVKLLNNIDKLSIPKYKIYGDSGLDVRYNGVHTITLNPGNRVLVPTGLFVDIPFGYEIQVRPRSGLAIKEGITVLNTPGTIDSPYRGEIGIPLINHSKTVFIIQPRERIAQIVLCKVEQLEWEMVSTLSSSDRGEGGFGHTGKS